MSFEIRKVVKREKGGVRKVKREKKVKREEKEERKR